MIQNMNWFVNRLLIKDHAAYFPNAPRMSKRTCAVLIFGIICPWLCHIIVRFLLIVCHFKTLVFGTFVYFVEELCPTFSTVYSIYI